MSRFSRGGINWEGRRWALVRPLVALAGQIEALYPTSQGTDGTVASKAHDAANPTSDHRPYPYAGSGVVRAIDVGESSEVETGRLVADIVAARDPRMAYLIYEGLTIWSVPRNGYPAWTWQPYRGPNPHRGHFHLSTMRDVDVDADGALWNIGDDMTTHTHEPPRSDLPRAWADQSWANWVARSITDPKTRTHDFYREDMSWVYDRVIAPLERQVDQLRNRIEVLEAGGGKHSKTIDVRLLGEIL